MNKRAKAKPQNIVDFTTEGTLPMWTANTFIRNRSTGQPLLVIHVFRNATLVVDPQNQEQFATPKALLERDYHYWARDTDMKNQDEVNYEGDWYAKPVFM